jgi:WD40 repeat protein
VLQKREPVGIRPAGLTGMGGIGKTQLAVEYVYRYRNDYPQGVFWVNAAEPVAQGLAQVGAELRPETLGLSFDQQLKAVFQELKQRPGALLVFDNIDDTAQLTRPVGSEPSPLTLACRILFTTRRRELGRFQPVEVSVLPEEPALQLLLSHPQRHVVRDDPHHPERSEAREICQLLGRLPLALELAGAFLGENFEMPLADYRQRLRDEGCIATIEEEVGGLSQANFQPTHEVAIAATLRAQWDVLKPGDEESARLVLRVAGQLSEAAAIPVTTLGLLSGVCQAVRRGHRSPLEQALKRLHDVRLVEELLGRHVRLHPLVREFSAALTSPEETSSFRHACTCRVVQAFENISAWEDFTRSYGIDGLEQCLTTAREFASPTDDGIHQTISSWTRIVRREAHHLRGWASNDRPNAFAQQILFRATTFGNLSVALKAEEQLSKLAQPCLLLRWRTLNESPALIRILTGHEAPVNSVAVSPDGRRIVSGSQDRTVAVWDVEVGTLIHKLSGHKDRVTSVAVSPDGRRIVSGSEDNSVAVWDMEAGTLIRTLSGHKDWVTSVAVSPDGRRIVSASDDNTVAAWELESGTRVHELSGHKAWVTSVAVSPDGRRIVSGSQGNVVAVWDLEGGTLIHKLSGHDGSVASVAVSPDGRRVVSGSHDNAVAVWDLESGTLIHKLSGHQGTVASVAVSPDGRRIVSGSDDNTVAVWDLEAGELIHKLSGHHNWVTSVAVSPDGRRIVSGSWDKTVAVWDLEAGTLVHKPSAHHSAVSSVAVSPDGRCIVSRSYDKTAEVWDLEAGTLIKKVFGHGSAVTSVAVSPDGRRIAAGLVDNTVAVSDLETGTLHRLFGHRDRVNSVVVCRDERRIVSGSDDNTVAVWDLEAGELLHKLSGHQDRVISVAASPDARRIVSGARDNTVAIWDLEAGTLLSRLWGHQDWVISVAVSPDGRRIVSGSHDKTVAIWDLEAGLLIHQLSGHRDRVKSVSVSPDGRRIISGSEDKTAAVWDLEAGKRLATLALDGGVLSVAWQCDGCFVVAGDSAGNLYRLEYREP